MTYARCDGVSAPRSRLLAGASAQRVRVRPHVDDRQRRAAQNTSRTAADTRAMREHDQRRAVGQHVRQPLDRIRRIQRHVRTAGLEHRQQPDHHLQAALDAQRHARVRADPDARASNAQADWPARSARRTSAARPRAPPQRRADSARPAPRTARGRTAPRRYGDLRRVPVHQHLTALVFGEHAERAHRRARRIAPAHRPVCSSAVCMNPHIRSGSSDASTCAVKPEASPKSSTDSVTG